MEQVIQKGKGSVWQLARGWIIGIFASASFGLIPFFTLPVMEMGVSKGTIIFYRFLFSALIIGLLSFFRKKNLKVPKKAIPSVFALAMMYVGSAMFLFWGFYYMPSGVATVIHFLYPVFLVLILAIFYRQRISPVSLLAIIMAILGVSFIMDVWGEGSGGVETFGLIIVALSALAYALYIVIVQHFPTKSVSGSVLTLWVMILAAGMVLIIENLTQGGLAHIPQLDGWLNIAGLALIPTVLSNLALVVAIRSIGSTATSVLGAMEPLTAVAVGIIVFDEPIYTFTFSGILFILSAVTLIITSGVIERSSFYGRIAGLVRKK
ncbi:DMT family transporter [Porphyromonas canoris]|uniref:DMT family transporter n=1 Tax=Porphyromonas canoris TaxID=36875 RepID=UPI00068E23C7|nr:DMT family transporter [Porphyromonas canoris]